MPVPILAHGASTTFGYGDSEGGWADRLRRQMFARAAAGEHPAREVHNLGIPGQSIQEIVDHLPRDIQRHQRRKGVNAILGIFMVGLVEARVRPGEKSSSMPISTFTSTLHELGTICTEQSLDPIFVRYPLVDEARTNPWIKGYRITNDQLEAYSDVVKDFAFKNEFEYVSAPLYNHHSPEEILSPDGLHPNDIGHAIICDALVQKIDQVFYKR